MEENQNRRTGFHAFLRGIILFGFTMLILSLVLSGSIRYYIAPQMMPFIYFALGTFFVLSIMQIIRSTPKGQQEEEECDCGFDHSIRGSGWKKLLIYSIFLFPLLTGFVLPDQVLDSTAAAKRGVQLGSGLYTKPDIQRVKRNGQEQANETSSTALADEYLQNFDPDAVDEHYTVEDMYSFDGFDDYYSDLMAEWADLGMIEVTDENFLDVMTLLDMYLHDFEGRTVELMGFVYREHGLKEDELVVARFSMTCCTADSAVYGLLVKGDQTRQFDNDTWVRVTGTLTEGDFDDYSVPMLEITEIREVPKPDTPYVYPSYSSW